MAAAPFIAFDRVQKSYPGAAAPVLDDVSLEIGRGQFVALLGASGAGKTTLLKTVNRLVRPDSGAVRLDGEAVEAIEPPLLRRRIGYVFQGVGLFPHMTVEENIAIVPRLLGWDAPRQAARAAQVLALVELPADYAGRTPDALSGGQRQRVGVARALAAEPELMLMDEPFGALDPLTRGKLGETYRGLHDRLGLTTLMVTHDPQEAILLADRILVMEGGRVIADGTPKALLESGAAGAVALLDQPRRSAERVRALLAGKGRADG